MHNSLYEGSPTASEEGGGGTSPVKATLATRFYSAAAQAAARAAAAAAGPSAATQPNGTSSTSSSRQGGSRLSSLSASDPALLAPLSQLRSSIYSASTTALAGSSSSSSGLPASAVQRSASAPSMRAGKKGGQWAGHDTEAAASHTSLLDLQHHEHHQVAVELYVPTGRSSATARAAAAAVAKDTFWPCTFNLSKVIMGAGMMAIPRAFMLLGLLPGGAVMLAMGFLTFFTLSELISASEVVAAGGSYGALVRATLGRRADTILQLAVLTNCYVMNVVFVVVLGDILLGSEPDYGGLLPEWSGVSPAEGAVWWLRRDVVLAAVSLLVLLPLAAMRSMERLAVVNIIGVTCNGVFAGLMLALAASAASNGVLQPMPLLPDWSQLGSTPLLAAVSIASVVPVLLNCDVCHQSLHPLMPLLQPYSVARMQRLVALALSICNTLYMAVTICSGLVFGAALQPDVLSNVSTGAMAPLIGPAASEVMASLVRVGYLLSIIGSFVLLSYPLRQCLGDLLLPGGQATVKQHWLALTTVLVVSCAAIGCYLPSIWGALALVGSTASTMQAFIIPGLVVLAVQRAPPKAAAAAAARHSRYQQQLLQQEQGLVTPLLAPAAAAGDADAAGRQQSNGVTVSSAAAAVAAAAAAGSMAGVRSQHMWLRLMRQLVAVVCLLLGVGLFLNSVAGALWNWVHPTAEGAALMDVYRRLLAP